MNLLKRDFIKGIFFVLAAGSLSHYVYEWSGYSTAAGFLFPVNESTWEHMKLCFFPMLLYSFYLFIIRRECGSRMVSSMFSGTLAGTFSIPVIFYTYTGILGFHTLILDLAVFFFSVLAGFCIAYRTAYARPSKGKTICLALAVFSLALCFFLFTYSPPPLGIFKVPGQAAPYPF